MESHDLSRTNNPDSKSDSPLNEAMTPKEGATSGTTSTSGVPATPIQVVKPTMRPHAGSPVESEHPSGPSNLTTSKDNNNNGNTINNNNTGSKCEPEVTDRVDEEGDFDWNEYLDVSGAVAAPPTSFMHVENSLQNLYTEGMKLEVPNRNHPGTYWLASIVMTCGPLLRLRYEGSESDRSSDFWCDIATSELHPLGWSSENDKQLSPPFEIQNLKEFLEATTSGSKTVPSYLLEASGCTAVDQIKPGTKLEIQEQLQPSHVWIATVLENVGGRLLFRHDGIQTSHFDFWLFYLSHRVHPIGWAKENDCQYKPPSNCGSLVDSDKILSRSLEDACKLLVPAVIFKDQETIESHDFQEGMKLEAIDPVFSMDVCPATVTGVLNPYYFLVEIDPPFRCDAVPGGPKPFCCHANSQNIFPVGWARSNGIRIPTPRGSPNSVGEFDWDDYLNKCSEENGRIRRAPEYLFNLNNDYNGFEVGMKFEAVNPFQLHQICAATAIRVIKHLLWIQLDNLHGVHPSHIVPIGSHEIFPIGWCESNGYPLKVPLACRQNVKRCPKKVAIVMPKKQFKRKLEGNDDTVDLLKDSCEMRQGSTGRAWCPEIFVNHKCFSGPFLSKSRLASLPRCVGPGPVILVLGEVISRLVNVSYLPSRVLGLLQDDGQPKPGMQQQLIKAKYKLKTHRAMVNILRSSDRVGEFCRDICRRLECCPNLIGPEFVGDSCPENCYRRTKGNKPLMKRGKRRRAHHRSLAYKKTLALKAAAIADASTPEMDEDVSEEPKDTSNQIMEDKKDDKPKEKRKYVHRIIPKSDIVTRGAKLPNFSLDLNRRRRKRSSLSLINKNQITSPSNTSFSSSSSTTSSKNDDIFVQPEKKTKSKIEFRPIKDNLPSPIDTLRLTSNPLNWTVAEVADFMKSTDCSNIIRSFKEQEIDGQAMLLLTLPTIQEHLQLKLGPAIKLCHHIERIKMAFFTQYDS